MFVRSFTDTSYGMYLREAVVEKVTLCTVGTTDLPHEVCGWDAAGPTASLANLNACAGSLVLDSVEISYWGDIPGYGFYPHITLNGADWASVYGQPWTTSTDLVLDPPKGTTADDIAALHKLANDAALKVMVLDDGELLLAD